MTNNCIQRNVTLFQTSVKTRNTFGNNLTHKNEQKHLAENMQIDYVTRKLRNMCCRNIQMIGMAEFWRGNMRKLMNAIHKNNECCEFLSIGNGLQEIEKYITPESEWNDIAWARARATIEQTLLIEQSISHLRKWSVCACALSGWSLWTRLYHCSHIRTTSHLNYIKHGIFLRASCSYDGFYGFWCPNTIIDWIRIFFTAFPK